MKIKNYKQFDRLEIHWIDSVQDCGWKNPKGNTAKGFINTEEYIFHRTIGYYLGQSDKTLSTAQSVQQGGGMVSEIMKIPKCAISKIVKL